MAKKELRPIDKVISEYPANSSNANPILQYFAIPLVLFGLLGLIWSIPFPQLGFLGKFNGFVNWASFVIAFSIYYYYRLSPVISYGVLLLVFAFSAGIVGLEKVQNNGGPAMGSVCLVVFMFGIAMQYFASGKEGSALSPRNILVSPVWLIYSIFKKTGLKL
ncbi:hypothetical protein [Desertivirga brevis]|uniref:hypothetical protein n=1 Tax=Desertivirga brevis TaxID=2810310 RepID=UPI001A9653F9|nr:hypothetical protein [Pedobacter sp. SYSU D00873]